MTVDVAIIGGGPGGATLGCLLRKYRPELHVAIFEREIFPRDHVGESQLPPISLVLNEMGCWDKVEAANFPIKIGATYRWGQRQELWNVDFALAEEVSRVKRPSTYTGVRRKTAFQVDRSIYDKILLDHAREMGCLVQEGTKVAEVRRAKDEVMSLVLSSGEEVTARYYVDASGNSAILRRAMGVQVEYPTGLQNIAIWDYWQNAAWAVEFGDGGTRIQVLSLPYGWVWYIPLGPIRTSIGLVIPVDYYKKSAKRPEELYAQGLKDEKVVAGWIRKAECEGDLRTTKDWSFLCKKQVGPNWFLVGECAGFADPILSAGLTVTQGCARELAYTIVALEEGKLDAAWLKDQFERRQVQRIRNHIRFADYWYYANAQFKDLKEFTAEIAKDSGLDLTPEVAWEWIAQGGFVHEAAFVGTGGFSVDQAKTLAEFLSGYKPEGIFKKYNVFKLDLSNAKHKDIAFYEEGRITRAQSYVRGERTLPVEGPCELIVQILQRSSKLADIIKGLRDATDGLRSEPERRKFVLSTAVQSLEALVTDGWVKGSYDPAQPLEDLTFNDDLIHWDRDIVISPVA